MFRVLLVAVGLVIASPALAEGWVHDAQAGMAVIQSGDKRLIVTCAEPGKLGLIFEVPKPEAEALAGGSNTQFSFSEDGQTWDQVTMGLSGGKDRPYFFALIGDVADRWIADASKAKTSVYAAIGVPQAQASTLYSATEFSTVGSGAAIKAVRAAC